MRRRVTPCPHRRTVQGFRPPTGGGTGGQRGRDVLDIQHRSPRPWLAEQSSPPKLDGPRSGGANGLSIPRGCSRGEREGWEVRSVAREGRNETREISRRRRATDSLRMGTVGSNGPRRQTCGGKSKEKKEVFPVRSGWKRIPWSGFPRGCRWMPRSRLDERRMDESGKRATVPEIRVPTSRRNVDETWASGFSFSFHSSERGRRGRELHTDCACRVRVQESTLGIARSDSPAIHDDGLRVGPHVDGPILRVRDEGSDAVGSSGRPASTGIVLRIDLALYSTPTCSSASPPVFFLVVSNPWWWTPCSWRLGCRPCTSPLPSSGL